MFPRAYSPKALLMLSNLHRRQLLRYQFDTFRTVLGRRISCNVPTMATSVSVKPPNVLVYSETAAIKQELIDHLRGVLEQDCYTVYGVTGGQVEANAWPDSTALLVVQGSVGSPLSRRVFVDYFLNGGRLLSICSELSGAIVSGCGEVRGIEEVALSYEGWRNVLVTQEIRPFERSRVNFVEHLQDLRSDQHRVDIKVLAVEESSPSILTATSSNGKAVLTQILFSSLVKTDHPEVDLFKHFLGSLLGIKLKKSLDSETLQYQSAFLLGSEEAKRKLLTSLDIPNQLTTSNLSLHFQPTLVESQTPSPTHLPVLTATLPTDFSFADYSHHLRTTHLGRPTIYAPVMTTSMAVISHQALTHGLAVIPRRQTNGNGRNNNQWLSPEGCAMFSLQLHVPLDSPLGSRLPMVQHLVAVGVVSALRKVCALELDIGLKWPNDIYAGGRSKIGGIIVNSLLQGGLAVVNVGCGVNLNNSRPTTCVNDLLRELGEEVLGLERMLALVFNEIERIFEVVQGGNVEVLYEMYYKYWLHGGKSVTMKGAGGEEISGKIVGIDEYGYLLVEQDGGGRPICVHPDGNSFDMMKGLIVPKYC